MKTNQLLLFFLFVIVAFPASAQWTRDSTLNTKVRDSVGLNIGETKIATASNGNSYISWAETNFGATGYQYRMQLVDSNGYNLWGPQGITIDTAIGSALFRYDLKVDKEDNAIIAIQDHSTGTNKPVVFKVSQAGVMLWGTNGIVLQDTAATSGLSPTIGITDLNNVLVSWAASGVKTFSSTLKISATGSLMWADNLRQIDRVTTKRYERGVPVPTGGEGFILQYVERTGTGSGVYTMYAMRYDGSANPLWSTPTKVSTKNIAIAYFPAPMPDGYGGFFLSFTTSNPASASLSDVYVQRVYADGHIWDPAGYEAVTGSTTHRFEAGAAYVPAINKYLVSIKFTNSSQSAAGISMQRVDTAGNMQLIGTGQQLLPLSSGLPADIINVTGAVRMDSSLLIVYQIGSAPSPILIRAIKADQHGTLQWTNPIGIPVSVNSSVKSKFSIGDYVKKQVVIAWSDQRLSNGGAYAQNIFAGGTLGTPPCEVFVLSPASFPADTAGYNYNVSLSQTGGLGTVTYAITFGVLPPGLSMSSAGVITGIPTDQGVYPFVITATDANGCSNNYTYSITILCRPAYLNPFPTVCDTNSGFVLTGGSPAGGSYSGQNVFSGVFDAQAAGVGSHIVNYTYASGSTNPCTRTATQTIQVVHCATGVGAVSGGIVFRMYPNPTNGQITLKMDNAVAGKMRVRLVSLTGQTVMMEEVEGTGNFQKMYDFSAYPKGMYVVEVSSAKESARVKINLQ